MPKDLKKQIATLILVNRTLIQMLATRGIITKGLAAQLFGMLSDGVPEAEPEEKDCNS